MKITLRWLRELVDVPLASEALCDALTMAGLEVDGVEERQVPWSAVEIAEIVEMTAHPNADRLRLCRVRTTRDTVPVVCGASNMQVGDKVALAPPGAALPGGRRIERATIRGETSQGMLCSEAELEVGEGAAGILILPPQAPLGRSLADWVGADDTVLELGITPNRGDCLSVLGIAREVAALTGARLRVPAVRPTEESTPVSRLARVEVAAPDLCPRYCARVVRGVAIGPSPLWMRVRLAMVGVRPISNVVDATNYVMLERGQPLHAFDFARLRGQRVGVRRAGAAQAYATLDGVTRALEPDDLVIADAEGPVAVAGVIGGADSEIRSGTTDVLLESAFFVPATVRATARRLGVMTDSSYRFERGVDPEGTASALDRLAALVQETAGGDVARGTIDRRARRASPRRIRLRPARVNALLGTRLGAREIARPLRAMGAKVTAQARGTLAVVPPPYRFDVEAEIDLVEEVARLRGYAGIVPTLPAVAPGPRSDGALRDAERRARAALCGAGYHEMVSLAMVGAEENQLFPGIDRATGGTVGLVNPLSSDGAELRRSLLPGLVRALHENLRQREPLVAGFATGRVYLAREDEIDEPMRLALLLAGAWPPALVGGEPRPTAFADLKGALELVLARLHVSASGWEQVGDVAPYLHPGQSARITLGDTWRGVAGALHPDALRRLALHVPVWVAELDLTKVVQYCPPRLVFRPLPRFPAVERDIAVVVDIRFQAQQVVDAIREVAQPLVQDVRVFDQYTGAPIPEGKKSLAYTISYRASDRTLTDAEVNAMHEELVAQLARSLPVEVRR